MKTSRAMSGGRSSGSGGSSGSGDAAEVVLYEVGAARNARVAAPRRLPQLTPSAPAPRLRTHLSPCLQHPRKNARTPQYPGGLEAVALLRRYKRFLADVVPHTGAVADAVLSGGSGADASSDAAAVVVHCPNTGPMTGLLDDLPARAWCSVSDAPGRKYARTLEAVQARAICIPSGSDSSRGGAGAGGSGGSGGGGAVVGVHSALANRLAAALLERRLLPALGAYEAVKREVALPPELFAPSHSDAAAAGDAVAGSSGSGGSSGGGTKKHQKKGEKKEATASRIDFELTRPCGRRVFVEVKSVTLAERFEAAHARGLAGAAADAWRAAAAAAAAAKARGRKRPAAGAAAAGAADQAAAAGGAGERRQQQQDQQQQQENGEEGGEVIALFPDTVSERAQRHVKVCFCFGLLYQSHPLPAPPKDERASRQAISAAATRPPTCSPIHRTPTNNQRKQTHATQMARNGAQNLTALARAGHEAACLFVVQRGDAARFAPSFEKDPAYAEALRGAAAAGVQMLAVCCELQPAGSGGGGGGGGGEGGSGNGGGGGKARIVLKSAELPVCLDYKRPPSE